MPGNPAATGGHTRLWREPGLWVLALAAALYALLVVPHWKPSWDSAIYITLAKSLAHGRGYTYMGYAETKYPPGFPLMLTPIVGLFGQSFLLMRLFVAACAVGSVGMAYVLFRRVATAGVAVAVALSAALSYAVAFEATRILSDLPFMLVSLCALYAAERYRDSGEAIWFRWTVGLIVAAWLVRSIGFTLLFAFLSWIVLDLRREPVRIRVRRAGIAFACAAVVIGAWSGRNVLARHTLPEQLREGLSYQQELLQTHPAASGAVGLLPTLERRVAGNLDYYVHLAASVLTGRTVTGADAARWIGFWVLLGWLWALWRRRGIIEYYAPFYAAVLLLWPAHQGARFLVPIIPILSYYALMPALALSDAAARFAPRTPPAEHGTRAADPPAAGVGGRRLVLVAFVGSCLVWNAPLLVAQVRVEHSEPYYDGAMRHYLSALAWAKTHLPGNAVLATNRAPYGPLLADRRTYTVPWVRDDTVDLAALYRLGVTDVIVNRATPFLDKVIAAFPHRFREIHRSGGTVAYQVDALPSRHAAPDTPGKSRARKTGGATSRPPRRSSA